MSDLLDVMLTGLKLIDDDIDFLLDQDDLPSNKLVLLEIKGIAKELITRLEKA